MRPRGGESTSTEGEVGKNTGPSDSQSRKASKEGENSDPFQTFLDTLKSIDSKMSSYDDRLSKMTASISALENAKQSQASEKVVSLNKEPQFFEASFDGTRPKIKIPSTKHSQPKTKRENTHLDPVPHKVPRQSASHTVVRESKPATVTAKQSLPNTEQHHFNVITTQAMPILNFLPVTVDSTVSKTQSEKSGQQNMFQTAQNLFQSAMESHTPTTSQQTVFPSVLPTLTQNAGSQVNSTNSRGQLGNFLQGEAQGVGGTQNTWQATVIAEGDVIPVSSQSTQHFATVQPISATTWPGQQMTYASVLDNAQAFTGPPPLAQPAQQIQELRVDPSIQQDVAERLLAAERQIGKKRTSGRINLEYPAEPNPILRWPNEAFNVELRVRRDHPMNL